MNKRTYIVPRQKAIHLDEEELIADSPRPDSPQMLSVGEEEDGVAEVKAHNVWEEW